MALTHGEDSGALCDFCLPGFGKVYKDCVQLASYPIDIIVKNFGDYFSQETSLKRMTNQWFGCFLSVSILAT